MAKFEAKTSGQQGRESALLCKAQWSQIPLDKKAKTEEGQNWNLELTLFPFFFQTPAAAGGVFHSHSTGCQNNGRLDLGSGGSGKDRTLGLLIALCNSVN